MGRSGPRRLADVFWPIDAAIDLSAKTAREGTGIVRIRNSNRQRFPSTLIASKAGRPALMGSAALFFWEEWRQVVAARRKAE